MGFVLVVPMADFYMVEDFYMKIFGFGLHVCLLASLFPFCIRCEAVIS